MSPKPGRQWSKCVSNFEENWLILFEEMKASTCNSKTSIFCSLHNNLQFRHVCFRWVSHHLNKEQMQTRIRRCCERKQTLQNDMNFLYTVITGDETWVNHFDPLTRSTTKARKHTLPPKESDKQYLLVRSWWLIFLS